MNDKSILNKELNNGVAYIVLFIVGLFIVLSMISYIKFKVEDFTNGYTIESNN